MKRDHRLLEIVVAIVVRVVYFVGGVVLSGLLLFRMGIWYKGVADPDFRPLIAVSLAIGILSAAVGPYLQRQATQRGRGSLKEIKAQSEQGEKTRHREGRPKL